MTLCACFRFITIILLMFYHLILLIIGSHFCDYSFPTVFLNNYSRVLMVVRSYVLLASITFESHSTTGSTYIFPFLLYGFDYRCCPAPFACCCALPLYLTLRHFSGFSSFFHLVCCGLNVF